MNVTGIIAEYNPFHKGHEYQIQQAKEAGADYIIVLMSGDFVQRGEPALLSKYDRAQMALLGGADLVLELPCVAATASAREFARTGVSILAHLEVPNHLCFGCENDNLSEFQEISSVLMEEPPAFKEHLNDALSRGISFPSARASALSAVLGEHILPVLEQPNNILALEYLMAMESFRYVNKLTPLPIKRVGAGYHDTKLSTAVFPSASSIRKHLTNLEAAIPKSALPVLENAIQTGHFATDFDYDLPLLMQLLRQDSFENFLDCNEFLSNKIKNALPDYVTFDSFCAQLKSKDVTYLRLSRILTHIFLDIADEDLIRLSHCTYAPYAKVLGIRKTAFPLLSEITKEAKLPIITNVKKAPDVLSTDALHLFEKDLQSYRLYEGLLTGRSHEKGILEIKRKFLVV